MKNDQYFKLSACILANDQIIDLTEALGIEGFGAFVSLLLELRQRDNYRCAIRSLPAIARRLNTTQELLLQVVYHFGLFRVDEDEQLFSSPYLDEVMGNLEARRKKQAINRENGLKGGRPPKCPKEVKEVKELTENPAEIPADNLAEKPDSKPTEKPNQKPNRKPNRKPNSKPTEKPTPSETPMNTGRKPNQNPVEKSKEEKSIVEKSKGEKRTSSSSSNTEAAEVDVEVLFRPHIPAQGTSERFSSASDVRSYFGNFNHPGTPPHLCIADLPKRACSPRLRDDPYRYEQHSPHSGQRSYCGYLIPPDAPPRPTENAVWSDELRQWG